MTNKVIKGELSIVRSSDGFIRLSIVDELSHAQFVELKLTYEQFAEAVTGCHTPDIDMEVRGLNRVGKRRVRQSRSVLCPLNVYNRELLQTWLVENCQEEGWTIDTYLGSQSSTKSVDGGTLLNYAVFKYVEVE